MIVADIEGWRGDTVVGTLALEARDDRGELLVTAGGQPCRTVWDPVPPVWWVEKWIRNRALRNLRAVDIGSQFKIERDDPRAPWRLVTPKRDEHWGLDRIVALLRGLPLADLARIPAPTTALGQKILEKARERPSARRARAKPRVRKKARR